MIDTLMKRVDGDVLRTDECWVVSSTERYARVFKRGSRTKKVLAHRLVYESLVGPIPGDLTIDHLCGEKHCVNPAHLEPVDRGENARRYATSLTECKRGHAFIPESTYLYPDGRRECLTCRREVHDVRAAEKSGGPWPRDRACAWCGLTFSAHTGKATYCSPSCKSRAWRNRPERTDQR